MARSRTAPSPAPAAETWADSAEEWSKARLHNCYFPSGARCTVQFPSLGTLSLADAVPSEFADLARAEITHALGATGYFAEKIRDTVTEERSEEEIQAEQAELSARFGRMLKWLVAEHVLVAPKVKPEDLSSDRFSLPDIEWLYSIATRTTDIDGRGRRLGVASLDALANFPGEHGCAPDCQRCHAALDAGSTAELGAL